MGLLSRAQYYREYLAFIERNPSPCKECRLCIHWGIACTSKRYRCYPERPVNYVPYIYRRGEEIMEESETSFEKWKQENKVNFDNFVYCCLHTVHKGVIEAHFK